MGTFEALKQALGEALPHLYDPTYHPPEPLFSLMDYPPEQGGQAVQAALLRAIEQLKPGPEAPPNSQPSSSAPGRPGLIVAACAGAGGRGRGGCGWGGLAGASLDRQTRGQFTGGGYPARPGGGLAPHPAGQLLLTAIEKLVQGMPAGEIGLAAEQQGEFARLTVSGSPVSSNLPLSSDFIGESLTMQGGAFAIQTAAERVTFQMMVPLVRPINVLVVDDNADLVHFYRRYTAKTRYQIHHLSAGEPLFAAVEATRPDIIVLDVMLPDMDGWELLTHLHEHPATRAIPVIVCSVVRREELALALGAALYLPKPVRRQEFIQALEQVLPQASTAGPIVQANSAATD